MTQPQIDEARAALAALSIDEQELNTLATQRAEEISSLKATGSKDFAALAALEGQRAALQTMLTEQRGYVAAAQANITALEAEAERTGRLERIGAIAAETAQIHAAVRSGLDTLAKQLTADLERLFALEQQWGGLRQAFQQEARQLGQQVVDMGRDGRAAAESLYAELAARGVDVTALTAQRLGGVEVYGNRPTPLITAVGEVTSSTSFQDRVPLMVARLYVDAWNTWAHLRAVTPPSL